MLSRSHRVDALIRSAHRRNLTVLSLEQAALAASLVFAGFCILLLVGSQIFSWYWLVLLALAGVAASVFRLWGHIPNLYTTAQTLDRRLRLHDTLSTAWHLHEVPNTADSPAGRYQIAQAEAVAAGIDMGTAFPIKIRRSWAIPLALGAVAFALFSVRYLVRRDLNLQPALVPMHLDRLTASLRNTFAASDRSGPADNGEKGENGQSDRSAAARPEDPRTNDVIGAKNPASAPAEDKGSSADSPVSGSPNDSQAGNMEKDSPNGNGHPESKSQATAAESGDSSSKDGEASKEAQRGASEQQDGNLMNRMKDAVSSLLAKMKPSEGSQQRSSQSTARNAAAPDQDQTQSDGGKSQNQTSASASSQASAKSDSKGNEQGQATEMAQSAESKTSSSSERRGGNQSKSGIGKQDGEKDLKAAQELQAMGKLAEIIGKRSQEISGEMMVEVPSGKQQLKTGYTRQITEHSDTSGEINRDEIPLVFQDYVREYMARVHKQAPSGAPQH